MNLGLPAAEEQWWERKNREGAGAHTCRPRTKGDALTCAASSTARTVLSTAILDSGCSPPPATAVTASHAAAAHSNSLMPAALTDADELPAEPEAAAAAEKRAEADEIPSQL